MDGTGVLCVFGHLWTRHVCYVFPLFHLSLLRNEIFRQIFHCVTVNINVISLLWINVKCAGLSLIVLRRGHNSRATKFCTVSPSAFGCSMWDLLLVRLLEPRILR